VGRRGTEGRAIKIIFPMWMADEIDKLRIAQKCTFKDIVVKFCEYQLNAMELYWEIGIKSNNPPKTAKKTG